MIDRLQSVDTAAGRIVCTSVVPAESPVFEGHFPGNPLLPGVLMVETMAQASGYLILAVNGFARMPFLIRIDKAKMRHFVAPEAALTVEAALVHEGSGFAVTEARLRHDGKEIASAELRFRLMDFPSPALRELVLETAASIGFEVDGATGSCSAPAGAAFVPSGAAPAHAVVSADAAPDGTKGDNP